jgi:hypothetical protein
MTKARLQSPAPSLRANGSHHARPMTGSARQSRKQQERACPHRTSTATTVLQAVQRKTCSARWKPTLGNFPNRTLALPHDLQAGGEVSLPDADIGADKQTP